jgi:hypothetical protein
MKINYTEIETPSGNVSIMAENGTGVVLLIPQDPANSDYQEYLQALEEEKE